MSKPLAVVFQRRATREIEEVDAWWRQNRRAAADLFLDELERTLAVVALMPSLGAAARSVRLRGVRRALLKKSQYHGYYRCAASRSKC